MTLPTAECEKQYHPRVGVPMGHTFGSDIFVEDYNKAIAQWQIPLPGKDNHFGFGWCGDPVSGTMSDLSLTTFVGDVSKQHVSPNSSTVQGRV